MDISARIAIYWTVQGIEEHNQHWASICDVWSLAIQGITSLRLLDNIYQQSGAV